MLGKVVVEKITEEMAYIVDQNIQVKITDLSV